MDNWTVCIGISIGGGSDVAVEAANVVLVQAVPVL